MTYDYEHDTPDGERHLCTGQELIDRGFTVYELDEINGGPPADGEHDAAADAFLADAELETPSGCAGALRAIRRELEAESAGGGVAAAAVS